jgi:hypothetical protein
MAIKNIMICNIKPEYSADYIANVLLSREIAYVTSVTLIPEIKNNDAIFNIAYIDIKSYCETECAYDFIENLKYGFFILHNNSEETPWIIKKNTHNSGGLCVGTYTTNFVYENWIQEEREIEYPTFEEFKNELSIQQVEYPTFEDFKNEMRLEYAINNSKNITLRSYQHSYKKFQESQMFPREIIWRSEITRSVSDLSV